MIDVSFAIACFNAMPHLEPAVRSALAQRDVAVEVLIVDDGSSDGSRDCAASLAAADPRVRLLSTSSNAGPAGARNVAIEAMRGRWLAVLDSDDLIAPGRSRALIDAAESAGADLVADDLIVFGDDLAETSFLAPGWPPGGSWMTLERYFADSALFGGAPNPGFLKPMFRRNLFADGRNRYNPTLRIAEDDELIVRLLLADYRYLIVPVPGYRYRKHGASISHRLSPADAQRMIESEQGLRARILASGVSSPAYARRWAALLDAQAFVRSIDSLKRREPIAAISHILRRPRALRLFAMPLVAQVQRVRARLTPSRP